jgi:hypothetical protein
MRQFQFSEPYFLNHYISIYAYTNILSYPLSPAVPVTKSKNLRICDEDLLFSPAHLLRKTSPLYLRICCGNSPLLPACLCRKFLNFACAFVTNFSTNCELRTMNSLRANVRRGVHQSLSKTPQFSAVCVQNARIFVNFCKFFTIFCIFFFLSARLMRNFTLPISPNRYNLTPRPYLVMCLSNLFLPQKPIC